MGIYSPEVEAGHTQHSAPEEEGFATNAVEQSMQNLAAALETTRKTKEVDAVVGFVLNRDVVCDVAPLNGRLLLFYSDNRCPHEVRPIYGDRPRYATTFWYHDD